MAQFTCFSTLVGQIFTALPYIAILNLFVKGAIKAMKDTNKTETKREDIAKFKKLGSIFSVLLVALILSMVLYYVFKDPIYRSVHVVLFAITLYFGIRLDKEKKRLNIKTYKEVSAFCKGESLEDIEKDRQ